MKNSTDNDIIDATLRQLILAIADRLDQSAINATAAAKLAAGKNTAAAMSALMEAEPVAHDALDLFRAAMTIRSHLSSKSEPKSRR